MSDDVSAASPSGARLCRACRAFARGASAAAAIGGGDRAGVGQHLAPESYYRFTYAIAFAVNDVAMMFFFALMTKEVVEATAPDGVLHPWRRALLPVIAAIGATIVPALIYIRAVDAARRAGAGHRLAGFVRDRYRRQLFHRENHLSAASGGPVSAAPRDCVRRAGVPGARVVQPSGRPSSRPGRADHGRRASAIAFGLRRARVKSFWPYLLAAGGALVVGVLLERPPSSARARADHALPAARRARSGILRRRPPTAKDALSQFEVWWRYPAQVALFFFGLVNAGVPVHALEAGTWGLPIAVIVGKPLGILMAAGAALAAGLHLPQRVGWRELIVVGFIAAIGFSIGLFFCTALLPPGQLRSETSMGVLLSLAGAPLALVAARLLRVGRFARH